MTDASTWLAHEPSSRATPQQLRGRVVGAAHVAVRQGPLAMLERVVAGGKPDMADDQAAVAQIDALARLPVALVP